MDSMSAMRPGERIELSRRRMLGLSTMAAGLAAAGVAGCGTAGGNSSGGDTGGGSAPSPGNLVASRVTAPPPAGVLGADVDQNLPDTNFGELHDLSATWLRGFYNVRDTDTGAVADQPGIRKLLTAVGQGYGTVLNLKFDYQNGLPAAGSSEMTTALTRLDKALAVVLGKVDIVVIGNEPFYECGQQYGNLNEFYETAAQHTIDYRRQHPGSGKQTQIYLGALTDLEDPRSHTALTDRWLEFVKNNPSIAGTDCHPHVASLNDGQRYLDYILPRIRSDQKFLATEFSLVKLYKQHMLDPIPTSFADQYHLSRGTLVWQFARDCIAHPVPQDEWNEFLLSTPWFGNTKAFMTNLVNKFRDTGRCAVATYPLAQGVPMVTNFNAKSTPWLFTSMYCPHTVQQGANGLPGQNTTWTGEFRALQHN